MSHGYWNSVYVKSDRSHDSQDLYDDSIFDAVVDLIFPGCGPKRVVLPGYWALEAQHGTSLLEHRPKGATQ